MKTLTLHCPECGIQNKVSSNAEHTFCTTCGFRIVLGIHSYRSLDTEIPNVFCVVCGQVLDQTLTGTIYSCASCGEIICFICANVVNNLRYCKMCYSQISIAKKELKGPKIIRPRKKTGKPNKSRRFRKSKSSKTKTRTKAKPHTMTKQSKRNIQK